MCSFLKCPPWRPGIYSGIFCIQAMSMQRIKKEKEKNNFYLYKLVLEVNRYHFNCLNNNPKNCPLCFQNIICRTPWHRVFETINMQFSFLSPQFFPDIRSGVEAALYQAGSFPGRKLDRQESCSTFPANRSGRRRERKQFSALAFRQDVNIMRTGHIPFLRKYSGGTVGPQTLCQINQFNLGSIVPFQFSNNFRSSCLWWKHNSRGRSF